MILLEISEFLAALKPNRAICGLDLGDKTIGIAVSDLRRSVATPIHTVRRTKFTADAAELMAILTERNICGIILGFPLNMDGSAGPRVQSTQAFARNLVKLTDLPITFWDERLSTVAAERALLEADTSRKRRREVIDQIAASYILQGALDRLGYMARANSAETAGKTDG
jgi:putative Holliday junction resolvase